MAVYEEYANSIDEAYFDYLNENYPAISTKGLTNLPRVLERLKGAGVQNSSELSTYIVEHNLGREFPDVTGIVTISSHGVEHKFEGVSPALFALICNELGFERESKAIFKNFKSHASSKKSGQ